MEADLVDDVTFKQIEMFIAVSESLSMTEAARRLFIDQSVVSRWIRRLEKNLGAQLFERYNKGVVPTKDGRALYDELKPAFGRLSNALETFKSKNRQPDCVFRIGCLDDEDVLGVFNESVFPFKKLYPNVRLKIDLYSFDELRRSFINEKLDYAVSYYMGFGEYADTQHRIFREKPAYIILSKDSPAIRNGAPDAGALGDAVLYLIAPPEVSSAEEYMLGLCARQGFTPKKIKYMPNLLAIELAVRDNRGFTIGTDIFTKHFPNELRAFRISGKTLSESIALFWHTRGDHGFADRFVALLG